MTGALDELGHLELAARLGGRLLRMAAPLAACAADPVGGACHAALARLRNPYAIEDAPGGRSTVPRNDGDRGVGCLLRGLRRCRAGAL